MLYIYICMYMLYVSMYVTLSDAKFDPNMTGMVEPEEKHL